MTGALALSALFASAAVLFALCLARAEPGPDTGLDDAAPWITWRSGYSDEE